MEFNENGNRKVINVDIDDTLTNGEKFWEAEPTPNNGTIQLVQELYMNGHIIIIHTAREWGCATATAAWLTKNGVPYHGIKMEKGGADFYVDNKNIHVMELLPLTRTLADTRVSHDESNPEGAEWYVGATND